MKFVKVETPAQLVAVRHLFVVYAESLGFSLCFQGFDDELAGLPGAYAPEVGGSLVLLEKDDCFVGCVAIRAMHCVKSHEKDQGDDASCEMKKRIFFYADLRSVAF